MDRPFAKYVSVLGRRFARSERGVAAVEFALILPLMAMLYLGGFEVMEGISAKRQVTQTASTIALIVTQYSNISASQQMPGIMAASSAVLTPFSASNATVTVSLIKIDSSGQATVSWSCTSANCTSGRPTGQVVTVPGALDIPNTYLVFGETTYTYKPLIDFIPIGTKSLYSSIYMAPRQPGAIILAS